ncbi:MAG: L,D-transpeptidase [Acidobacteriota bacterium]|nr:L,D-transpeptidase [Acidobacteriota bacterium]
MKSKFSLLTGALLAASLISAVPQASADDCHWWQFGKCDRHIEGLPQEAPREGVVITVDVSKNRAYLFRDGELIADGPAATGKETVLEHGEDMWLFHTPRGHLKVLRKIENPVWTKPDWAFIETGERVPPRDSPKRQVKNFLGKYALALGDGILIHGTTEKKSLGRPASHGCIRVPADLLANFWKNAQVGTDVYIFDSRPAQTAAAGALPEHHSDLDYRAKSQR